MASQQYQKKYLCQAPRPEQWDEVAPDVLENLPRARQKLSQTLEKLQDYMDPPKRGPGRKSNGEHAFAFYEFLLDEAKKYPEIDESDEEEEEIEETACTVCQGETDCLPCSTCNRKFHKNCIKPSISHSKTWKCPYCVLKSEPKQSKARRQAAAAVRLIARMKNKIRLNKKEDKEESSESEDDTKESDDNKEEETPTKRQRKQPTLYDPQGTTPARKWVSDEAPSKKDSESDDDSDSQEVGEAEDDKDPEEPFCIFCQDDEDVPVCVFCACRVCFGKHSRRKVLLCDQCDDEYHLACLDPPLETVPPADKAWYCPVCAAARERKAGRREAKKRLAEDNTQRTRSGRSVTPSEKLLPSSGRKRGRPPSLTPNPAKKILRKNPPVTTVSRSGRKVRRSSFHDEIHEGDQHLRTSGSSVGSARPSPRQYSTKPGPKAGSKRDPFFGSVRPPSEDARQAARIIQAATAAADETIALPEATAPTETKSKLAERGLLLGETNPLGVGSSGYSSGVSKQSDGIVASFAGQFTIQSNSGGFGSANTSLSGTEGDNQSGVKVPRRKPGARECMQISRRFGNEVIPEKYMEILLDYCKRGKVEHLIRMRERLDEHARYLEAEIAGLEVRVRQVGESDIVVPPVERSPDKKLEKTLPIDAHGQNES